MIIVLNFLKSVIGFFDTIAELIGNLVHGIFEFFKLLPTAVDFTDMSLAYMPSVLLGFAVAGISICVILHILGR